MDRRNFITTLASTAALGFIPWKASAAGPHGLQGYIRTNWCRDPFSYGSYSYIAKGSGGQDIRHLGKPIGGRIFFAGEAANPRRNSTVHAAYESGQRTAGIVLNHSLHAVAIIGAGMSGLSAAQKLSRQGRDVTVFEARDRIGGRIWTNNRLGMPLDLGASWIHGTTGNPLTELADSIDLKRVETEYSFITRGRYGRLIGEHDLPEWVGDVAEVQHTAGADRDQINNMAYLFADDYNGPEVIFPNGYMDIFDALEGPYEINLSSLVDHISYDQNGVTLNVQNAGPQSFDAVIVTVPLGVLKKDIIKFDPPLPKHKSNAIRNLGMGTLDKVYLLFEKTFWDPDATWILTPENDLPQGQFNQWLNIYKFTGHPVILGFNGGPPALELSELSDEDIIEKALQTLNIAYPA